MHTYNPIAVPVAIPHMKLSLTHQRKGEFCIFSRMPPNSGRNFVHVADSGEASDTFAAGVSGIFDFDCCQCKKSSGWLENRPLPSVMLFDRDSVRQLVHCDVR